MYLGIGLNSLHNVEANEIVALLLIIDKIKYLITFAESHLSRFPPPLVTELMMPDTTQRVQSEPSCDFSAASLKEINRSLAILV